MFKERQGESVRAGTVPTIAAGLSEGGAQALIVVEVDRVRGDGVDVSAELFDAGASLVDCSSRIAHELEA